MAVHSCYGCLIVTLVPLTKAGLSGLQFVHFKDLGIWMLLSCLILQVKNWVIDFIARWCHWC